MNNSESSSQNRLKSITNLSFRVSYRFLDDEHADLRNVDASHCMRAICKKVNDVYEILVFFQPEDLYQQKHYLIDCSYGLDIVVDAQNLVSNNITFVTGYSLDSAKLRELIKSADEIEGVKTIQIRVHMHCVDKEHIDSAKCYVSLMKMRGGYTVKEIKLVVSEFAGQQWFDRYMDYRQQIHPF